MCCVFAALSNAFAAERINHEGRILGPLPVVTKAVLFNTPQADAIVSALQIFPPDNAWNEDISRRPLLANASAMISRIIADLASDRRTLRPFYEMNFVLVPDAQPLRPISFVTYPDESDPSPYPIPPNMPVEGWPRQTGNLSLYDWQRDVNGTGGDRHSIIVQPGTGGVWETWLTRLNVSGVSSNWQAANGAKFNLNNNTLRPAGWTSADAGGLSMFAGLVRYDECQRGMVEHAIRLIVKRTRREYIYPATHYASSTPASSNTVPAMGQRLRLKSGFAIPENWTTEEKAVLRALKKYGAIVADNGNFFSISVAPDQRFAANAFSHLSSISITNFEVVQTTSANQGPRSPGAPITNAGSDFAATVAQPIQLRGSVNHTGAAPLAVGWKLYSGPTNAVITDSAATNTTVTFNAPGTYTLMLSADDGVHAIAYDAVIATVSTASANIRLSIRRSGNDVLLNWNALGAGLYRVERAIPANGTPWNWTAVLTSSVATAAFPITGSAAFYRVRAE